MSAEVTIAGNLAADPELRFTSAGKAVVKITVMTSRSVKGPDGTWTNEDVTGWPVTCWERLAENVAESLVKGDAVIVRGYAASRSWESKEGEKRTRVEVTAKDVAASLRRAPCRPSRNAAPMDNRKVEADPWAATEEAPF